MIYSREGIITSGYQLLKALGWKWKLWIFATLSMDENVFRGSSALFAKFSRYPKDRRFLGGDFACIQRSRSLGIHI